MIWRCWCVINFSDKSRCIRDSEGSDWNLDGISKPSYLRRAIFVRMRQWDESRIGRTRLPLGWVGQLISNYSFLLNIYRAEKHKQVLISNHRQIFQFVDGFILIAVWQRSISHIPNRKKKKPSRSITFNYYY